MNEENVTVYVMDLNLVNQHNRHSLKDGFFECYKNNEYKSYRIPSVPQVKDFIYFEDNTGEYIFEWRVSSVCYFQNKAFIIVAGYKNVLDFIPENDENHDNGNNDKVNFQNIELIENLNSNEYKNQEEKEKTCSYCDSKATTIFTSKETGSTSNVCNLCEAKLKFQEDAEMIAGDYVKFEDISEDVLRKCNYLK